jgi:hypothetical protein
LPEARRHPSIRSGWVRRLAAAEANSKLDEANRRPARWTWLAR